MSSSKVHQQLQSETAQLKVQLQSQNSDKNQIQEILKQHNNEIALWKKRYQQLEESLQQLQLQDSFNGNYKERVEDLETKIKILIEENDKLNQVIGESIKYQE